MATSFILPDHAVSTDRRRKKIAKPSRVRVSASSVVDRLYAEFSTDMARLAE